MCRFLEVFNLVSISSLYLELYKRLARYLETTPRNRPHNWLHFWYILYLIFYTELDRTFNPPALVVWLFLYDTNVYQRFVNSLKFCSDSFEITPDNLFDLLAIGYPSISIQRLTLKIWSNSVGGVHWLLNTHRRFSCSLGDLTIFHDLVSIPMYRDSHFSFNTKFQYRYGHSY